MGFVVVVFGSVVFHGFVLGVAFWLTLCAAAGFLASALAAGAFTGATLAGATLAGAV